MRAGEIVERTKKRKRQKITRKKKDARLKKRERETYREEFRSRSSTANVGADRTSQPGAPAGSRAHPARRAS